MRALVRDSESHDAGIEVFHLLGIAYVESDVADATSFAEKSPLPNLEELHSDVYVSYPQGHFSRG